MVSFVCIRAAGNQLVVYTFFKNAIHTQVFDLK